MIAAQVAFRARHNELEKCTMRDYVHNIANII